MNNAYKVIDIYIIYARSEQEADWKYQLIKKEQRLDKYLWRHFASPVKEKNWRQLLLEQIKFW